MHSEDSHYKSKDLRSKDSNSPKISEPTQIKSSRPSILRFFCRCFFSTTRTSSNTRMNSSVFLLPVQAAHTQGRKTLVLDLDETLAHVTNYPTDNADFALNLSSR
jgi:hypothetical protein